MKKNNTVYIILAALFTALMAVFAQIQIPTPFFPITLQTLAIAICGYTLGVKFSLFSILAYILLGVAGAPVFSGFCGGFHHVSGPAGGFVIGFPFLVLFCALACKFKNKLKQILTGIIGVVVMYLLGIVHFILFTNVKAMGITFLMFAGAFVKDIILCTLAFYISNIIKLRIIKKGS